MTTFIIVIATAIAVYNILLLYGVLEIVSSTKKVTSEIETNRKNNKARKHELDKLRFYSSLINAFRGILMSDNMYEKHTYYIARLELRSEILNRPLTPEEIRGSKFAPFVLSLLVIPIAIFKPALFILPGVALAYFIMYPTTYENQIREEDTIIDDYFIDLYLLLYSKLKQGSRARLQNTVENYIDTLEASQSVEVKKVMLKLARYLLNLLSLYEDHVAIPKLKEIYHSATVINFSNVASQSLNGVENFDNLLTFKMMLVERKTEVMRKRSRALVRKGEMSIYAIYVILFIFVVIGFYSKLPSEGIW